MIDISGKYGTCRVFAEETEESAWSQLTKLINHPMAEGSVIRVMPDVHAGSGCVIGYTATLTDKIAPNLVGVDIGCGVEGVLLSCSDVDMPALDNFISNKIPSGFSINASKRKARDFNIPDEFYSKLEQTCDKLGIEYGRVELSLGSLGGGNHFIELASAENGIYLVVHSGSRNFGLQVAKYHGGIAKESNPHGDLSYLTGADADGYLADMVLAQQYAEFNRRLIIEAIVGFLGARIVNRVVSVHNYIDMEQKMVRKGAISAKEGQMVIIPWNMRDGSIIGVGKGNEDWNNSAPHGAGRVLGRKQAKSTLNVDEFKEVMSNIYSSCVSENTLDESPMAYKDHHKIKSLIEPSVTVLEQIVPIYNYKST